MKTGYKYEVTKQSATHQQSLGIKDTFEDAKTLMLEMQKDPKLCCQLAIHKRKVYSVVCHSRLGGVREQKGCLTELIKHYSNLLSWWHYATPKTIDKLIEVLNRCVDLQQGGCYNRDYFEKGE